MPIVTLTPNTTHAEETLANVGEDVRGAFYSVVRRTWEVPGEDILIRINRCPTLVGDPASADVDIWVETNPVRFTMQWTTQYRQGGRYFG